MDAIRVRVGGVGAFLDSLGRCLGRFYGQEVMVFLFLLGLSSCGSTSEETSPDGDGDGFLVETGDCDDSDPSVYPDAVEYCDLKDNDCNGDVDDILVPVEDADEMPETTILVYADRDGDGYGSDDDAFYACTASEDYLLGAGDCNDQDEDVHPGVVDTCDNVDSDCDGITDEDPDRVWYPDEDFDGYGVTEEAVYACSRPTNVSSLDGDCDDGDPEVGPGADEACDGIDNDCDGVIDNETAWYSDADGDGYGDTDTETLSCEPPTENAVTLEGDCDDADASTYPGADEVCDGIDNDCDAMLDENLGTTLYFDGDGDGAGSPSSTKEGCAEGEGYVFNALDCDDADPFAGPLDFEPGSLTMFYRDGDGDGFGTESDVSCEALEGYITVRGDCDDQDPKVYPGAEDVPEDGQDSDCGGFDDAQPHLGFETSLFEGLQAAIEAAPDASILWVGPGRWLDETFDVQGKNLQIRSTHGALQTFLDAGGMFQGGRVVSGESLDALLDGFTLQGGMDSFQGGALLIEGSAFRMSNLILEDNSVGERNATALGGGLYAENAVLILSNVFVNQNRVEVPSGWSGEAYGGGIAALDSYLTMRFCRFEDNQTIVNASESAYGGAGALYLERSSFWGYDLTFSANKVELSADMLAPIASGGALRAEDSFLELSALTLLDHQGIDFGAGFFLTQSSFHLDHLWGVNNQASERGGALYFHDAQGEVLQSLFESNTASDGGALAFYLTDATLSHLWLESNQVTGLGGGFYSEYGSLFATHCVLLENDADRNGGGLYAEASDVWLEHMSFLSNYAALGGGVYVQGDAECVLRSSLFAWNDDYNFYQDGIECSLSSEAPSDFFTEAENNHNFADEASLLEVQPQFVSYRDGNDLEEEASLNLHLALDSPLIDLCLDEQDRDGSPADLGHYGGPSGGDWDLDDDGMNDYYWPGHYEDVPEGESGEGFEAEDRDSSGV